MIIRYLVWLNTEKRIYCIRYSRFVSNYDISDINKYGHVLVNVLHLDYKEKKFLSMSFKEYNLLREKRYKMLLVRDRIKNLITLRSLRKTMSNELIKIAQKISK